MRLIAPRGNGVARIWCQGGTTIEAPKARALRRRVGWGMGKGVRSAADYGVWESVVSSPSEVRGGAPAAIAYSAYFRPQNASGSKKNTACIKLQRGGARAPVPHAWRRHCLAAANAVVRRGCQGQVNNVECTHSKVGYVTTGWYMSSPLNKMPLSMNDLLSRLIEDFLGTQETVPNGISIGSAVLHSSPSYAR